MKMLLTAQLSLITLWILSIVNPITSQKSSNATTGISAKEDLNTTQTSIMESLAFISQEEKGERGDTQIDDGLSTTPSRDLFKDDDDNKWRNAEMEDTLTSTQTSNLLTHEASSRNTGGSREPSETNSSNPLDGCPSIAIDTVAGAVVKCHCQADEILVDGKCQPYHSATLIHVEMDWFYTIEANTSNYQVIIRDVKCNEKIHHFQNFTKGQYRLRTRGDMILLESAGSLYGQRLDNYCILHHLDNDGDLTWTMKACVPIPSVPRCCPPQQAMKDGFCQPAKTPNLLTPPIAAKPFYDPVEWTNITNYLSPITCKDNPIYTIPLNYKKSNLVSLAKGLANGWVPGVIDKRRKYYYCPNYCVDGIEDSHGSIEYHTSFCYSDPIQKHKEVCGNGPCLRKCCEYGYSLDVNRHDCVPDENSIFDPPTVMSLPNYKIVIGWPLCTPSSKIRSRPSEVDTEGSLLLKDRKFLSTDYCVETFKNNTIREQSALACLAKTSKWIKVRPILFPVCNTISLLFLGITIAFHLLVPKLLAKGGVHQLCHAIALVIAYSSSFTAHVFHDFITRGGCISIAIIMQFGFLTTFFWLNVMCFEIWRKIRRLKNFRPCKTYPTKYYMLYAWGIPFSICLITIGMQYLAKDNVPGLIKPYIGVSRCWFREDIALLVYFYGPVAFLFVCNTLFLGLTYFNYKTMLGEHRRTTKTLKEMGTGVNMNQRNATSSMPSRQLTDHVNDFKQKLKLFVLMATCWVTEVLSWKIPPVELWALTDTLNSLQGFFIFIILLSNRNKRRELEENNSRPFKILRSCIKIPHKIKKLLCHDGISLSPVNSLASSVSMRMSNSTMLSTFTSSLKRSSNSSFSVNSPSPLPSMSISLDSSEGGVITLSHTPLSNSKSLACTSESPC